MSVKEQNKVIECMGNFSAEMLKKILKKMKEGYCGWDNENHAAYMQNQLTLHAKKCDYIDVANIAMFLWSLEQKGINK